MMKSSSSLERSTFLPVIAGLSGGVFFLSSPLELLAPAFPESDDSLAGLLEEPDDASLPEVLLLPPSPSPFLPKQAPILNRLFVELNGGPIKSFYVGLLSTTFCC